MARRFRKSRAKGSGRALAGARKHELKKRIQQAGPEGSEADWPDDLGLEDVLVPPARRSRRSGASASSPATEAGGEPRDAAGEGEEKGETREAEVLSLASGLCWVRDEAGEELECVLPSRLAAEQQSSLAVGDRVRIRAEEAGVHRVSEVLDRRTVLSRPDPHNPRKERVIAANVDVVVHVASVKAPPLRPALIDRYLIATWRGGAEALIAVNKVDLLESKKEWEDLHERLEPYRRMDLPVLCCSARSGQGLEELRERLRGRTAVFAGHSGVGKSSLLNRLAPEADQATAEVSAGRGTGRHTTTRSSLHLLGGGIRLIDTPGIRELGLWDLEAGELASYFPDLAEEAAGCRFSDCSHTHEPDCAVRAADRDGHLHPGRYATYLRIRESLAADEL